MQTVGAYLRERRTARGVSLDELSRATRVGQEYLEALESDAFDKLPAPVFTKGFIRAYCLALGEPADEVLSRFRELTEGAPTEPALALTLRPKARGRGPVLVSLVLLLGLGLALFFLTLGLQGRLKGPSGVERVTPPAAQHDRAGREELGADNHVREIDEAVEVEQTGGCKGCPG